MNTGRISFVLLATALLTIPPSAPITARSERMSATDRLDAFAQHRAMVAGSLFSTLPWQHGHPLLMLTDIGAVVSEQLGS